MTPSTRSTAGIGRISTDFHSRRGQRRRRPPSPPPRTTCSSDSESGSCRRCLRCSSFDSTRSMRRAGRDSRGCRQGPWDRRRGRCGGGDAGRENGRRPLRGVLVHGGRRRRRMASDPAGVRQRPVRLGGKGRAVPPPGPVAVPDEGAAQAHESRLREAIQRAEGARGPDARQFAHRRARGRGPVLHRQSPGAVQPHVPNDLRGPPADARRRSPALRDAEHGWRRRCDQLLGRRGALELLASHHRHPTG
jgi:hypothetical protein